MRPKVLSFIAALVLIVTFAPTVHAGGWATAALVEDPGSVTVGEPFVLRYVVRGHGMVGHEIEGMITSLEFINGASDKAVTATGVATLDPTVYEATVSLPTAGPWKWKIVIHNYLPGGEQIDSPMPALTATNPGAPIDESAVPASGMTTIVTITSTGFSPEIIEVAAGDTITWVNEGMMAHQVASTLTGFETSPMIQPGEAYFQTLTEPGTFNYLCPPHPGMTGTVVVS